MKIRQIILGLSTILLLSMTLYGCRANDCGCPQASIDAAIIQD